METILTKCKKCGAMHYNYESHECHMQRQIGYSQAKEEVMDVLGRMKLHDIINHDAYRLIVDEIGEVER